MQWPPKVEHAIYHIYVEGELARRVYTYVREERSGLASRAYVTEPADCGLLGQRIRPEDERRL
jgi:hypothetical protein